MNSIIKYHNNPKRPNETGFAMCRRSDLRNVSSADLSPIVWLPDKWLDALCEHGIFDVLQNAWFGRPQDAMVLTDLSFSEVAK